MTKTGVNKWVKKERNDWKKRMIEQKRNDWTKKNEWTKIEWVNKKGMSEQKKEMGEQMN